jgi:hypothetical protein
MEFVRNGFESLFEGERFIDWKRRGGARIHCREHTVRASEVNGSPAIESAGLAVPGWVSQQFPF